ncbi:MAG: HD domain-containing protein [Planctomycetota bacterium]
MAFNIAKSRMNMDEERLRARVEEIFSATVPRYYKHTVLVVDNMKGLMRPVRDARERDILLASAYLHDIGYSAPYGGDYAGNIKDQAVKVKYHSEKGAEIARDVLKGLEVNEEVIQKVAYLVSVHHREDIEDRHLKVLLEADKAPV